MLTIDDVIDRFDGSLAYSTNSKEICQYIADLLKELKERRKAPEIIRCGECRHKGTKNCVANTWATIFGYEVKDDFYCGLAERRTE